MLDLILALANEPAARILPSRVDDRTLSRDLGILYSRVDANLVNIVSFIPLAEVIVRNEPGAPASNDADIWVAVFELVARNSFCHAPDCLRESRLRHATTIQLSVSERT